MIQQSTLTGNKTLPQKMSVLTTLTMAALKHL